MEERGRQCQELLQLLSEMYSFQHKIMKHTKKRSMTQTSRKVSESACERIQMSDLAEKAFKEFIINVV